VPNITSCDIRLFESPFGTSLSFTGLSASLFPSLPGGGLSGERPLHSILECVLHTRSSGHLKQGGRNFAAQMRLLAGGERVGPDAAPRARGRPAAGSDIALPSSENSNAMRRATMVKDAVRETISSDRLWIFGTAGAILAVATLLTGCI
jgi:hypothetical protein